MLLPASVAEISQYKILSPGASLSVLIPEVPKSAFRHPFSFLRMWGIHIPPLLLRPSSIMCWKPWPFLKVQCKEVSCEYSVYGILNFSSIHSHGLLLYLFETCSSFLFTSCIPNYKPQEGRQRKSIPPLHPTLPCRTVIYKHFFYHFYVPTTEPKWRVRRIQNNVGSTVSHRQLG